MLSSSGTGVANDNLRRQGMKKTAIGMVLAAATTGVAYAQTNVTLYGVADGNLRFDHTNLGTLKSVGSGGESGSRWGIRGVEDLGGGLRATFVFEQGIDITDNSSPQGSIGGGASAGFGGSSTALHSSTGSRLFSRIATVGLGGRFGEVRFGRGYSPLFLVQYAADPYAAGLVPGVANVFVNNTLRNDNAIFYDTPVVAGFQGLFNYQLGESTTNNTANAATGQAKRGNDRLGAGITYTKGPLYAGVGYEHIKSNLDLYKVQTYDVVSTYDFGVVKLHALFWYTRNNNPNTTTTFGSTTRLSERTYFVGATVPFGAWTLIGSWGHLRDNSSSNINQNLGTPRANLFGGAAKYSLSKRSVLYAAYARFSLLNGPLGNAFQGFNGLSDASNAGLYTTANLTGPAGVNVNPWSFQMGLRHTF